MRSPRRDQSTPTRPAFRHRPNRLWVPFPLRLSVARARAMAVRHRVVRRTTISLVVVATAAVLGAVIATAREARAQWGETISVVVAVSPAPVGTPSSDLDVDVRVVPVAMTPADALRATESLGDRLVTSVQAGEVLTARDFSSTRADAERLPAGTRAVALPVDAAVPEVRVGDLVDMIVVADPFGPADAPARAIRPPAIVVAVTEDSLTLAVDSVVVNEVVAARADGRVTLAAR